MAATSAAITREVLASAEYALKQIDSLKRGSAQVGPADFTRFALGVFASVATVAERKTNEELAGADKRKNESSNDNNSNNNNYNKIGKNDKDRGSDADKGAQSGEGPDKEVPGYLSPLVDEVAFKTAAVSLHNQSRTLLQTSQQYEEIRAVLKSTAALM